MIDMILSRPETVEFSNLAKGLLPDNVDAQAMLTRFGAEAGSLRAIDKVYRLAMSLVESGDDLQAALSRSIKLSGGK